MAPACAPITRVQVVVAVTDAEPLNSTVRWVTIAEDLHAAIDLERVVRRTQDMVRLPSVNPFQSSELSPIEGEGALADWLAVELAQLGYDPQRADVADRRPNIWGMSPGTDGPVIALVGHLDTVGVAGYDGDPFSGDLRDGRIHGRGTCDMKGAFACFLEVAEVLRASAKPLNGRLMIVGLADEEAAMLGSSAFGQHAPLPDMAIVGEPTELAICTAHLGQFALPIRTFGRAAHSSIASQGVNAIEHMTRVVSGLRQYQAELDARVGHPMCGSGSVNAGVIRGGEMVSIVPDWCELEVDRRVAPGETSVDVRAELTSLLERLEAEVADFRWELGAPLVDAAPLDTPMGAVVVRAAQKAAQARTCPDEVAAFPGATDAPNLGVPAIIWGPGSLDQAHTVDEFVAVDQLEAAAHLYLDAVLEVIG